MNKKLIPALLAAFLATSAPALAIGPVKNVTIDTENLAKLDAADQERVLAIRDRLEEIAALDRGSLSRSERKDLRSEVRALTSEAKEFNARAGGTVIYLSTAGIIIILLLLIILL